MRIPWVYPTQQLSVLVPADLRASSSTLSSLGLILINQRSYHLYQAKDLPAGAEINTQLAGLPVNPAANSSTLNPASLWLVVGLLMLLAALFVTRFLYRFPYRPASATQRQLKRGQGNKDISVKKDVLPNQQQELLQALLDLDTAFEAGKIKQAEYRQRRAKTKARLRTLISAETAEKTGGTRTP